MRKTTGNDHALEESRALVSNGPMTKCTNISSRTGLACGAEGPDSLRRYCSDECADRGSKEELDALGITSEMMKEAMLGYYECKDMIERDKGSTSEEPPTCSPCSSSQQ